MTDVKEAVINNMLTRRTIRRFLDRQIGEEELQTGRAVCGVPE